MQVFTSDDERHMHRALALALRGQGRVEPNPMVGCVIVRGGRVVGEGYHRRFGGPHAEIEALKAAGAKARGSVVYMTLEPCCHFGKTPPCTDALLAAGIRRVVAAMPDPFPKVRGRGTRLLDRAGIDVATGLLEAEAIRLNAPYLKRQREGRPWVILKWAQSLDGKIATRTGDSKWISGERSRHWVHRLRGRVDAIIVGVGTVVADDPQLTCRHGRPRRTATRIVLDPRLRTPLGAGLVRNAREIPTLIIAGEGRVKGRLAQQFVKRGVEIMPSSEPGQGLDLAGLLDELGRRGMTNVLVEGGGRTLGAFYDAGLADEALIFLAPILIGGAGALSPLAGLGPECIRDARRPAGLEIRRCGEDILYQARFA